jgi:hypothetical protein
MHSKGVKVLLSHIVVKGSRSSKFVVYTVNVRAQHAEQLISGLKYKQAGSVLRRWRSPVRIRLATPMYLVCQNCMKYSALKTAEARRMRVVDLKVDRWQMIPAFRGMSFGSFEVRSA